MAETRKSIIDEAFMEAESIEQAFKANSKEILTHTMGSEIEEMVKESLEGSIGLNEDEDEENVDLELDLDSDEAGLDAGDDLDLELGDEDEEEMDMDDLEMGDMEMDSDELEVIDLTGEEDSDKIINVFKKMSDDDEIEVVQTGDGVEFKDNETGAEYKVELGGDSEMEMDDEDMEIDLDLDDEDMDMEDMDMDDEEGEEIEYQIELDDEDDEDMDDEMSEGDYMEDNMKSETMIKTPSKRRKRDLKPNSLKESYEPRAMKLVNENKVLKNKISSIVSENETLKEDYNKMVDALKEFRQKLNEVAVFNSNLTYSVRLFTEHSTTKGEKVDIIKRFDDAKTLKESKNVYKTLVKEISKTKAPIKESIDNKLNETKSSGSATEITESKVYVDPQIEKMKSLWNYDYKK